MLRFGFSALVICSLLHGTQTTAESSGETDYDNASFFIDSVHSVASDVAKVISLKAYFYKNKINNTKKIEWGTFYFET